MSQNLHNSLNDLPQFLSSRHLVDLGLYPSLDAVYLARVRGHSPDFIKLKRKVLYPKDSVLKFIEQRMKKGGSSGSDSDSPQHGQ
jgi:hypothetical protein